jgi:hypothetical protein
MRTGALDDKASVKVLSKSYENIEADENRSAFFRCFFFGRMPSVFGWTSCKIYRKELNVCKTFIGHLKITI